MNVLSFARVTPLAMESRSRSSAAVLSLSCFSLQRSLSSTRHLSSPSTFATAASSNSSSAFNFSVARSVSPKRILQATFPNRSVPSTVGNAKKPVPARKVCMCSPSNHPGSFRCSIHRKYQPSLHSSSSSGSTNYQLHMGRSAMTNSLVRIGSVEGEWVKRALTALIRPSNHQMRRRTSFQPRLSRLCQMTRAEVAIVS